MSKLIIMSGLPCLKHYKIECAFDDRPRIIKMWEEQGVKVFDVGDQIEF